jgi:hypothetical protein
MKIASTGMHRKRRPLIEHAEPTVFVYHVQPSVHRWLGPKTHVCDEQILFPQQLADNRLFSVHSNLSIKDHSDPFFFTLVSESRGKIFFYREAIIPGRKISFINLLAGRGCV